MTPTQVAADIKGFLERGRELLESHVPELVERAQQAESNPLLLAVENAIHLPGSVKALAADFITKLAAEFPAPTPPDTSGGAEDGGQPAAELPAA